MNIDWKNLARLAVVTFIQGALAVWAATGFTLETFDWRLILGGGIAALASLAYNIVRTGRTPKDYSLEEMALYIQENRLINSEHPEKPAVINPDEMGFKGAEGIPAGIEVPDPSEVG